MLCMKENLRSQAVRHEEARGYARNLREFNPTTPFVQPKEGSLQQGGTLEHFPEPRRKRRSYNSRGRHTRRHYAGSASIRHAFG